VLTPEAIDEALAQAPDVSVPPTFAVDVARRVRLDTPPAQGRVSGPTVGLAAATVLIALMAAWQATSDDPLAVVPLALLVLACGEAIVLAAWSLPGDRSRRA
jgi:hypothetical protein